MTIFTLIVVVQFLFLFSFCRSSSSSSSSSSLFVAQKENKKMLKMETYFERRLFFFFFTGVCVCVFVWNRLFMIYSPVDLDTLFFFYKQAAASYKTGPSKICTCTSIVHPPSIFYFLVSGLLVFLFIFWKPLSFRELRDCLL